MKVWRAFQTVRSSTVFVFVCRGWLPGLSTQRMATQQWIVSLPPFLIFIYNCQTHSSYRCGLFTPRSRASPMNLTKSFDPGPPARTSSQKAPSSSGLLEAGSSTYSRQAFRSFFESLSSKGYCACVLNFLRDPRQKSAKICGAQSCLHCLSVCYACAFSEKFGSQLRLDARL